MYHPFSIKLGYTKVIATLWRPLVVVIFYQARDIVCAAQWRTRYEP